MAATTLFSAPFVTIFDSDGNPVVGAEIRVFAAGTSSEQDVFTDPALGTPWDQPIVTNAAGQTDGPVYVSPTPALKIVVVDSEGSPCVGFPVDSWSPAAVGS